MTWEVVKLAFDDDDNWEEDIEDYLRSQAEVRPWTRGSHGKFVITPDGELVTWATNPAGEPHHDMVASEMGLGQILKGDIAPSGAWWITDQIDPRANPDIWAERVAPQAQQQGLRPIFRGYAAKVIRESVKSDICDRCLNPYEDCTCPPSGTGEWAADDPIADPFRDLKSPFETFSRTIPEPRWGLRV